MNLIKRFLIMTKRHWSSLFLAVFGIIGAALLNLVTPDIVRRLTASLSVDGNMTTRLPKLWRAHSQTLYQPTTAPCRRTLHKKQPLKVVYPPLIHILITKYFSQALVIIMIALFNHKICWYIYHNGW